MAIGIRELYVIKGPPPDFVTKVYTWVGMLIAIEVFARIATIDAT